MSESKNKIILEKTLVVTVTRKGRKETIDVASCGLSSLEIIGLCEHLRVETIIKMGRKVKTRKR